MKVEIQSRDGCRIVDLNRRRAIREKCLNCSGWSIKDVEHCTFQDTCSLFPFRMSKGKQNAKERNRAIKAFCVWCMAWDKYEVKRCTSSHCSLFAFRGAKADTPRECPSLSEKAYRRCHLEGDPPQPMMR